MSVLTIVKIISYDWCWNQSVLPIFLGLPPHIPIICKGKSLQNALQKYLKEFLLHYLKWDMLSVIPTGEESLLSWILLLCSQSSPSSVTQIFYLKARREMGVSVELWEIVELSATPTVKHCLISEVRLWRKPRGRHVVISQKFNTWEVKASWGLFMFLAVSSQSGKTSHLQAVWVPASSFIAEEMWWTINSLSARKINLSR